VGRADRLAVPLMAVAGVVLTWAALTKEQVAAAPVTAGGSPPWLWGLDVVIGYQVSWLLMFADYSRFTRSARASGAAVFAGLALPALWLLPVGWSLARIAGSDDPGTMLAAAGVGWWTALLVALASVTTNFVNIYLSSLAWRTLVPRAPSGASVWAIGLVGTALGLVSSGWLVRFADFMLLLGSVLVPVGGVFLAHFVVLRRPVDVAAVYDRARLPAFTAAGMSAWIAGSVVYHLAAPFGATLPALTTAIAVYVVLARRAGERRG
jgi:purine-cytosine permease-like protein